MPGKLDELKSRALELPPKARARLAEQLIASLDGLDDEENERLWIEEAERRYRGYKKGHISSRPAKDVLRDARRRIR